MASISDFFLLDTSGHCFLCLAAIPSSHISKSDSEEEDKSSSSIHLLHYLSRYLKLDMTATFHETASIPPELLTKVKESKLKVPLCKGCALLNNHFSKLYRQLEKTEMEARFVVRLIHRKIVQAEMNGYTDQFRILKKKLKSSRPVESLEKFRIVEALRTETLEKCERKTSAVPPKVKILRLTKKQINDKIKNRKMTADIAIDETIIKAGSPQTDFTDMEYFEENFDSSEQAPNVEMECSEQDMSQIVITEESATTTKAISALESCKPYTIIIVEQTRRWKCSKCLQDFGRASGFWHHHNKIHLQLKHKCDLCGAEFHNKSHYTRHQKQHMGVRYQCSLCSKLFSQKSNLRIHQQFSNCAASLESQQLSAERRSFCSLCDEEFGTLGELRSHLGAVHPQPEEHECDICGKKFKEPSRFNTHRRKFHPEIV